MKKISSILCFATALCFSFAAAAQSTSEEDRKPAYQTAASPGASEKKEYDYEMAKKNYSERTVTDKVLEGFHKGAARGVRDPNYKNSEVGSAGADIAQPLKDTYDMTQRSNKATPAKPTNKSSRATQQ